MSTLAPAAVRTGSASRQPWGFTGLQTAHQCIAARQPRNADLAIVQLPVPDPGLRRQLSRVDILFRPHQLCVSKLCCPLSRPSGAHAEFRDQRQGFTVLSTHLVYYKGFRQNLLLKLTSVFCPSTSVRLMTPETAVHIVFRFRYVIIFEQISVRIKILSYHK